MKLTGYELKKLFGQRLLLWIALVLLVVNAVIAYCFTEKNENYFYLKAIGEDYRNDPDAIRSYYAELETYAQSYSELYRAYMHGELTEEPQLSYPCKYSGVASVDDYVLLKEFFALTEKNDELIKKLDLEIHRAEINKQELLTSYSGTDENSFAYRRQALIGRMYTNVRNRVELMPEQGYGWDSFFGFDAVNIFMALLVVIGSAYIFMFEKGNASLLLHSSPRGRSATAAAKLAAALIWSAAVVAAFLMTTLGAVALKCGTMSDMSNYIAVFDSMSLSPYAFTIAEYLAVFCASKLLLFSGAAIICIILTLICRSVTFGFLLTSGVLGIDCLLYITATDEIRHLSLVAYARNFSMISGVRPINVSGYAVDAFPLMTVVIAVFSVACVPACIMLFACLRLGTANSGAALAAVKAKLLAVNFNHRVKRGKYPASLLGYEACKVFSNRLTLIILAALSVAAIFTATDTYASKNSYSLTVYREYTDRLSGPQTDEKRKFIEDEYNRINTVVESYGDKRAAYLRGEMGREAYNSFLKEYNYARERVEIVKALRAHSEYLDELAERDITGCYLYDTDWLRIANAGTNPFLIIILILIVSGVFADEYKYGSLINIIRTTKKGRKPLFVTKIIFSAIMALFFSSAISAVDCIMIFKNLNLPDASFPLASLEIFGSSEAGVSIAEYFAIAFAVRLLLLEAVCIALMSLGTLIKNKLYMLAVSFLLVFAPKTISDLGVRSLEYIDITAAFDFTRLYFLGSRLGGTHYMVIFIVTTISACIAITAVAWMKYCKNDGLKFSVLKEKKL